MYGSLSRPISEVETRTFEEDGVVCLRNAFHPNFVLRLRRAVDEAVAHISASPSGYDVTALADAIFQNRVPVEAGSARQYDLDEFATTVRNAGAPRLQERGYEFGNATGRFLIDTDVGTRDDDFRAIAMFSNLPEIAATLLRSSRINLFNDQIFVKEARTLDKTGFHQDLAYFNFSGDQACVFWIPLDSTTRSSGSMRYLRGSHRWGRDFKATVFMSQATFPDAVGELLPEIEDQEDQFDIVTFDVAPGDLLVHHVRTVHGAGGNLTDAPRRAVSLRYCGDDIRFYLRPGAPAQLHHQNSMSDGDVLNSTEYPLVWPPKHLPQGGLERVLETVAVSSRIPA